jgi:hypothetical protein
VQQDSVRRAGLGKRVGNVVLFVALAVVPVLALNSLATATPTSDGGGSSDGDGDARPVLTDAQRECLAERGVSIPDRSGAETRSALTREQRRELRQAGKACGVRGMGKGQGEGVLTDAQRQCLTEQGVTVPPQSAEQRAALRAAAEACGLPAGGHHLQKAMI